MTTLHDWRCDVFITREKKCHNLDWLLFIRQRTKEHNSTVLLGLCSLRFGCGCCCCYCRDFTPICCVIIDFPMVNTWSSLSVIFIQVQFRGSIVFDTFCMTFSGVLPSETVPQVRSISIWFFDVNSNTGYNKEQILIINLLFAVGRWHRLDVFGKMPFLAFRPCNTIAHFICYSFQAHSEIDSLNASQFFNHVPTKSVYRFFIIVQFSSYSQKWLHSNQSYTV